MSIHEKISKMTKEELADFIFMLYNTGWFDGAKHVDNESYVYFAVMKEMDFDDFCESIRRD